MCDMAKQSEAMSSLICEVAGVLLLIRLCPFACFSFQSWGARRWMGIHSKEKVKPT